MAVMRAWAHLHLPRLRSGVQDVISLKVPGEHIDYASVVELTDVEFKVHEHGRQRCIREGVRNVHAWVVGDLAGELVGESLPYELGGAWRRALYDPWKGATFVDAETLEPVTEARSAVLVGKDVHYR
ncbi:hypothetical protein SEA_HAIZUM_73 [Streptomyces phage Haizum]|nr:hypothetical protein SEA_HAIZUM_73 [Streptomyces phage Haizum]QAY15815.1 hypothetical protein SEA_NISHIKIGOI_74 [Streptomyces phage Nishikigoi]